MLLKAGGFDGRLRRLEDLDVFLRFAQVGGCLETIGTLGAQIQRGRNAQVAVVDAAVAVLTQKFVAAGQTQLPAPARRRLRAWLAVEQAVAAKNDGRTVLMLRRMAQSFALVPRRTLHLSDWWQPTAQAPVA
jgi:hypothetical protein